MWLTRFGGDAQAGTSAGIAYQGSLSPVSVAEGGSGDASIASPLAAMVASPRTTVTSGQQDANRQASLPVFQPGSAPTVVPESHAIGGAMLAFLVLAGLWLVSGMKVK